MGSPRTAPIWKRSAGQPAKALDEYIQGEKNHVSYMDCLWGELYGAINSNQWSNVITMEQADYLRAKYLY